MGVKLKKLKQQTIVITGASSGIGRTTARMAADRGARVVLAARSEEALRDIVDEIRGGGGEAIHVVADVGKMEDVERIAEAARRHFGGFDTWVNNAGVSIYGEMMDTPLEDMRRLYDTNFWGVVHGSLVAARHFARYNNGGRSGAIINVGSTLSDRAIGLQGIYSSSKHAVKGFTDALRMELEADGAPISVTLIKPGAINTPYTRHAKNYLPMEPNVPPPVYAPETVARAILHCAEKPERDLFVGGGGKAISASGRYAPRLTDQMMELTMSSLQQKNRPARPNRRDGLHKPSGGGAERGDYEGHVAETSLYTEASLHPVLTGALLLGTGVALAAFIKSQTDDTRS